MNRLTQPALLFDLDGTLIDSVYQHVAAWHRALIASQTDVPAVRIHRSVGMSGRLMLRSLFAEAKLKVSPQKLDALERAHKKEFQRDMRSLRPLPGARELLKFLSEAGIRWAIATSGDRKSVERMTHPLDVPRGVPIVTADDVQQPKPHPDAFLEAAGRLGIPLAGCTVVGDSVWDMLAAQRAKALGVGLLTGGYAADELAEAGAFRVYKDPAELLARIAEVGVIRE